MLGGNLGSLLYGDVSVMHLPHDALRLVFPHYAKISVQYTAIFHGCKNDNFQMIFFTIFIFLLQTCIVGTR